MNQVNPRRVALLLIILLAAGLRLYGQDWDRGHYLHPDERFIASVSSDRVTLGPDRLSDVFDPAHSPINPRRDDEAGNPQSFAYGTLPIYVQGVVSWLLDRVFDRQYGEYGNLYRVGRTLTALVDLVTLISVYLLGRRLFSEAAGLIGAALYGLAVLPIQLSHFFAVDPWLTAFVTLTLYLSIRYLDHPTLVRALVLGVPVGCAFATKASVPALLAPLLLTFGICFWRAGVRRWVAVQAAAGGMASLVIFTLFEPYALVRSGPIIQDIRTQAEIVRGIWDVPFTRQFVGLTPGIYELKNLFGYTIGPAFLLAGIAGLLFAARRAAKVRDLALAIPLVWVAAYVPTLLITEARFLRYTLPLIPIFALVTGGMLAAIMTRPERRRLGQIAAATVIGVTAVWAFGFVSIYGSTHPRVAASEWIYENVPPGSVLTAETWDDSLPLRIEGESGTYQLQSLDIYGDLPPEEKADDLYDSLATVDYVVMSSDRLVYSVDNLPWRYAVQNEYYRRLLDGQLGFQLVYRGELRPELFGYRFDDSGADESFTVYDHPRVQIFRKVETLSREEFRARLLWGIAQPWEPVRYPTRKWLRLDGPAAGAATTDDVEWDRWAVGNGLVAALVWLVALELFGLAVLPWAAMIFNRTPDRGALAARLLGILFVGWVVWMGASLGLWPATTITVAAALVTIGIGSWGWYSWRYRSGRTPELPSLRAYAAAFALLLAVFVPFLLFRALYPDFWQTFMGGEKPFELAYLRAVAASREMPPYDPWFSDGVINYYYYGWHLVSTVARLPGVGVNNAFQLAVPTFAALLAMQVALIGLMLARVRRSVSATPRRYLAAGLSVLAVLFIGNLDTIRQISERRGATLETFDFWASTRVIDYTINEFPYFSFIWADLHPHLMGMPVVAAILALLIAAISHVGPSGSSFEGRYDVIGVLGFFGALALGSSFVINAWDMPLMIAVTVATLVYAGLLRSRRAALVAGLMSLVVVGLGYFMFLPFHANFYSVVEGVARAKSGSNLTQFLMFWGIFLAIVGSVIAFRAAAATRGPERFDPAFPVLLLLTVASAGGLLLASVFADRAANEAALVGFVISLIIVAAAAMATRPLRFHLVPLTAIAGLTLGSGLCVGLEPAATVALGFAAAASMFAVAGWRAPTRFLPWAFIAVGCVAIASTEFVYIVDDLQNGDWQRMNTVFKFYLQAWILVAIGAAALLARMSQTLRFPVISGGSHEAGAAATTPESAGSGRSTTVNRLYLAGRVTGGISVLMLAAGLTYPLLATPVRLRQDMQGSPDGLSLDGYAWMEEGSILNATGEVVSFNGDLAAIHWLRSHAGQTDVIVEAGIGPYRGNGARISSGTGMPAVIGWDRHQYQQRYPQVIAQRMADVRTIYSSTDANEKLELLRRYNARYVVVGDVERLWNNPDNPEHYASEAGLATFEAMLGGSLRLAFVSGTTRVYEVLEFPRIRPAENAVHQL